MANEFKVGDVVRLKSGGPKMTVVNPKAKEGETCFCAWWNNGDYKGQSFNPDTLMGVATPSSDT